MTNRKDEEIIDLTELIEEEPFPSPKGKGENLFLSIPTSPGQELKNERISSPVEEDLPVKKPLVDYSHPPSPGYEAEILALQERWNARIEAWFAKEGTEILERAVRENFPKIAEKVLRSEIEKMKTEIEEPE